MDRRTIVKGRLPFLYVGGLLLCPLLMMSMHGGGHGDGTGGSPKSRHANHDPARAEPQTDLQGPPNSAGIIGQIVNGAARAQHLFPSRLCGTSSLGTFSLGTFSSGAFGRLFPLIPRRHSQTCPAVNTASTPQPSST
jgi:hypothetical protein